MTLLGWFHIIGATLALTIGALVLTTRKGTRAHVRLGRAYGSAMLLVNLPALFLYEQTGGFGPFHIMALASLVTLTLGLVPLLLGYRTVPNLVRHGFFMAWSYVGLVAAGLAQVANHLFESGGLAVLITSLLVIGVGGLMVHGWSPQVMQAVLGTSRGRGSGS